MFDLFLPHPIRKYRCTDRTPNCTKYENETSPWPPSSNFISHSLKCQSIPSELKWDLFEARDGAEIEAGVGAGSEDIGIEAQHGLMDGFIAHGLQNPGKPQVTSQGFREHLVKGIIKDDHANSLGEKPGMKKVFAYLLPRGISAPSHQTVQRDLEVLCGKLNMRLNKELQVHR
jgi:hypothetical protein